MNQQNRKVIKFAGYIFTMITAIMFYNHLFVALFNPGYHVTVYFDYYGEGFIELIFFIIFIPFIIFTFLLEVIDIIKIKQLGKKKDQNKLFKGKTIK